MNMRSEWARQLKYVRTFSAVLYCINQTRYVLVCTGDRCPNTWRSDYRTSGVHVSIGGFVICVERCSTMGHLAGTAQFLLNCILLSYTANCGGCVGMVHLRVLGIFIDIRTYDSRSYVGLAP